MVYRAGSYSRNQIVPAIVPPISMNAIDPQNTDSYNGTNAGTAASDVRMTGRPRCTVVSLAAWDVSSTAPSSIRILFTVDNLGTVGAQRCL